MAFTPQWTRINGSRRHPRRQPGGCRRALCALLPIHIAISRPILLLPGGHWLPRWRGVLPVVVGERPLPGAVRPHDEQLAIRLERAVVGWRFILEPQPRTAEQDVAAIGRPGAVRVIARRIRQLLEAGAV